jgi:hypothetical protein
MKRTSRNASTAGAVTILAASLIAPGTSRAINLETGNEDVQVRWDNKVSFTAGVRTKDRDSANAANPAKGGAVASEFFSDKGEVHTTRFDLFSEMDVKYKADHGFRLSASAWWDPSFPDRPNVGPAGVPNSAFGPSGEWPGSTKRFYRGPSAEFLDAFAFTRLDLGSVPAYLKLGRLATVWGESAFGGVGGLNTVGFAQSPNDSRKSTQNPSAGLKETTLPLAQLQATFNLTPAMALSAYRTFEFRANRVPASGTYYGFNDGVAGGQNLLCAQALPFGCFPYGAPLEGEKNDWGLMLKGRPSFVDASVGLVYREFSEKGPWFGVWNPSANVPIGSARSVYGRDTKLIGVTANTTRADIAWGAELSYRENAALASDFSALTPVALGGRNGPGGLFNTTPTEGARGNTVHALLNGTAFFGKGGFWDTFVVVGEVGVSHLAKVTRNPGLFQSEGTGFAPVLCNSAPNPGAVVNRGVAGCVDRTAGSLGIFLNPTMFRVMSGVDLEIPVFAQFNFGTSPLNGGGADRNNTFSLGLKATYNTDRGPHVFQLTYLKFTNRTDVNNPRSRTILGAPYYDRDQLLFTYTASF